MIIKIVAIPPRSGESWMSASVTPSSFCGAREQPQPCAQEQDVREPCHLEREIRRGPPDRETERRHDIEPEDDENADAKSGTGRGTLRTDAKRHGEQREDEACERPRKF